MKKQLTTLFLILSTASVAQVSQKGEVVLINSKSSPISGVELIIKDASPTVTDKNGYFILEFPKNKEGELMQIMQISKKGYGVVNNTDLESWIISTERKCKIVMCTEGYLNESRLKFYNMGNDIYRKRYANAISELDKLIKVNKISEEQYKNQLEEAKNDYSKSKELLTYYADKFSRINRDELKGTDSLAMTLFDNGNVDEAIQVYEKSNILEKVKVYIDNRNLINNNINDIKPALIKQIKLYLLSKDNQQLERGKFINEQLLILYPDNKELLELQKAFKTK